MGTIFIWKKKYTERVNEADAVEPVLCQSWSSRASKMTQPNLDYMGKWEYICVRFASNVSMPASESMEWTFKNDKLKK